MEIVKIENDKAKYMDWLLIADEQVSMIEKYLYRGDMYALLDDDVKALCVVTQEGDNVYEIKNIVTLPKYQSQGYGRAMLSFIAEKYGKPNCALYVGTGDSPNTLEFYHKCGFVRSHVVKNFFTNNYDHEIYENGKQLVDMIYLRYDR